MKDSETLERFLHTGARTQSLDLDRVQACTALETDLCWRSLHDLTNTSEKCRQLTQLFVAFTHARNKQRSKIQKHCFLP